MTHTRHSKSAHATAWPIKSVTVIQWYLILSRIREFGPKNNTMNSEFKLSDQSVYIVPLAGRHAYDCMHDCDSPCCSRTLAASRAAPARKPALALTGSVGADPRPAPSSAYGRSTPAPHVAVPAAVPSQTGSRLCAATARLHCGLSSPLNYWPSLSAARCCAALPEGKRSGFHTLASLLLPHGVGGQSQATR